jgi:hypothetical protein
VKRKSNRTLTDGRAYALLVLLFTAVGLARVQTLLRAWVSEDNKDNKEGKGAMSEKSIYVPERLCAAATLAVTERLVACVSLPSSDGDSHESWGRRVFQRIHGVGRGVAMACVFLGFWGGCYGKEEI